MIVDDQPAIIQGLKSLIDDAGIAQVVKTETDGKSALASAIRYRPDLVLVDVSMPDMNGIEIVRNLKKNWQDVNVLAISAHANDLYVRGMLDAGARGYLLKDHAPNELCSAIDSVMQGNLWIGTGLSRQQDFE